MFSIIGALFIGWFLSLFGFDHLIIDGMDELFQMDITTTGYYFIFAVIGIIRMIYASSKK